MRSIRVYRQCDALSGIVLLGMIALSPWLFGSTQPAVISGMNVFGYLLWGLLAIKWGIRTRMAYRPPLWTSPANPLLARMIGGLALLTVAILAYMLISALNARAVWQPETESFTYQEALGWLPQSYDQKNTWQLFANYLALAGVFWALWDWLRGKTPDEDRAARRRFVTEAGGGAHLPARLRLLLWVLCLNGGLLALEAIVQRQSGTTKLLWLVEPRVNKETITQFGPYAYRANAAQYFNLLWPLALGFWWTLHRSGGFKRWRHHLLLPAGILMAAAPFISTARGGALVAGGMMVGAIILLAGTPVLFPDRPTKSGRAKLATVLVIGLFFGGAALLARQVGWSELELRMTELNEGWDTREQIYETARGMAKDYRWFGTGPGTFNAVFPLYRKATDEYWPAQLHNDWLETRITFGWIGMGLILLALGVVAARWWLPGGIHGGRRLVGLIWLALAGALVHARFDFPFQIYSILMLVLVHCAVLLTLSRRGSQGDSGGGNSTCP